MRFSSFGIDFGYRWSDVAFFLTFVFEIMVFEVKTCISIFFRMKFVERFCVVSR